jgi:hypothetical protein
MFGTRAVDSIFFIAILIALALVVIILFGICIRNMVYDTENISLEVITVILCVIAFVYMVTVNIYSKKQGADNIKEAINDNYSNAENILVQFDRNTKNNKGYFTSEDKNFSFEVINNTLVIKDGETVVKYISGDNY